MPQTFVGSQKRTKKTLRRFFADMWNLDRKFRKNIKIVCTNLTKSQKRKLKELADMNLNTDSFFKYKSIFSHECTNYFNRKSLISAFVAQWS